MAGRNHYQAVQAFLKPLRRATACVTKSVLVASGNDPAENPHAVTFPTGPAPLDGPHRLHLHVAHHYRVVPAEGTAGPWRVHTAAYYYHLLGPNEQGALREILLFHWHPEGASAVTAPHAHVPAYRQPIDLSAVHLPTPRVSLELVLRLAIENLGAVPLKPQRQWRRVLGATEEVFERWRTWG